MSRALPTRLVAACLLLGGCEYDLDVGPAWQIDQPRVLGMRMVVVEPGPTWPERLGFDDDDAPIAEALPGDRVEFQALAVDGEGRVRAPESVDTLWFQCRFTKDLGPFVDCAIDVPACDSLDEWTTDVSCELGRGGALEFTFPALGQRGFEEGSLTVLGIIAREPGTDVERCRADILASSNDYSSNPDRALPPAPKYEDESPACTLVEARVLIGPAWALQYVAAEAGFEPALPLEQIPYLAWYQPANRSPAPAPPTWRDSTTGAPLEGSPPRVRAGQWVSTGGPNWRVADRQFFATAQEVGDTQSFVFIGRQEGLGVLYFASGPIQQFAAADSYLQFAVDEFPATSTIRVVMLVGDHRPWASNASTVGMFVTEFEVVP